MLTIGRVTTPQGSHLITATEENRLEKMAELRYMQEFPEEYPGFVVTVGVPSTLDFIHKGVRYRQDTSAPVRYVTIHPAQVYELLAGGDENMQFVPADTPFTAKTPRLERLHTELEEIQAHVKNLNAMRDSLLPA